MEERMIDNNICPYCGNVMKLGYLGGVRYQLEWIPEGKKQRLTMLSKNTGIPLNKTSILKLNKVYAYYCNQCDLFIIRK